MLTLSVRVRLWRERHKLYLSNAEPDVGCSKILFIEKGVWIIFEPRRSYQSLWLPLSLSGDNSVLPRHGWTAAKQMAPSITANQAAGHNCWS